MENTTFYVPIKFRTIQSIFSINIYNTGITYAK